ncbi:Terminase small subunit [compost metagenome]
MADLPGRKKKNAAGEPVGKPRLFCEYYIGDDGLNGALAARKAGYSAHSSGATAYRLMNEPVCQAYIAKLRKERSERLKVDADYVLQRLYDMDQMDIIDILNDDMSLKNLSEWPKVWRQALNGVEIADLFENDGDARKVMGVLKKIKWIDRLKNLELMGKHIDVGAFAERVIEEDAASLAKRLAAARKRRDESK